MTVLKTNINIIKVSTKQIHLFLPTGMEGYLVVSYPSSMFHVVDCLHHIVLLTPDAEK